MLLFLHVCFHKLWRPFGGCPSNEAYYSGAILGSLWGSCGILVKDGSSHLRTTHQSRALHCGLYRGLEGALTFVGRPRNARRHRKREECRNPKTGNARGTSRRKRSCYWYIVGTLLGFLFGVRHNEFMTI